MCQTYVILNNAPVWGLSIQLIPLSIPRRSLWYYFHPPFHSIQRPTLMALRPKLRRSKALIIILETPNSLRLLPINHVLPTLSVIWNYSLTNQTLRVESCPFSRLRNNFLFWSQIPWVGSAEKLFRRAFVKFMFPSSGPISTENHSQQYGTYMYISVYKSLSVNFFLKTRLVTRAILALFNKQLF